MIGWIKKLFSIKDEDEITSSFKETIRAHEDAVALARSVRKSSTEKVEDLHRAIQLARMRTTSFADLESSIRGKTEDADRRAHHD